MRTAKFLLPLALIAAPALAEEAPAPADTPVPAAALVEHHAPDAAPGTPAGMQPGGPGGMMGGPGGMMGGMMGGGRMGGGMSCPMMKSEHVEGRIAFLHTELKITAAQEEAWKAFADALRTDASGRQDRRDAMMDPSRSNLSVPADMSAHITMMEQKLAAMKATQAATEKLYGVLTDDQKKSADELLDSYR